MDDYGYFLFSLDTELATGHFDLDTTRKKIFSKDGVRERKIISTLLDMMDEYEIAGTWAIVGHLFYQSCENCPICPIKDWQGKYSSFGEVYQTANPLWYGADVVDKILGSKIRHEIAFHGYTHEIFDEKKMTQQRALLEIREWKRVAQRKDIIPKTVIFPRNTAGYLKAFQNEGFICYRGEEFEPLIIRNKYFGKYVKVIDHLLSLSRMPIYTLETFKTPPIFNLISSQHIFGIDRKLELFIDWLGLPFLRLRRILRGIEQASIKKKVVHIWAHPWEFRTEKDFRKLEVIFRAVRRERQKGTLRSISMSELAERVKAV